MANTLSPPFKTLFLCTGNCCRSQMAEALLRHLGGPRFEAFSAGSRPAGYLHPLALGAMERMGVSTAGQWSKHVEEFDDQPMGIVLTVCSSAARVCPHWPGAPVVVPWPVDDPGNVIGSDEDRERAADAAADLLRRRIARLVALPLEGMTPAQAKAALLQIAQTEA